MLQGLLVVNSFVTSTVNISFADCTLESKLRFTTQSKLEKPNALLNVTVFDNTKNLWLENAPK